METLKSFFGLPLKYHLVVGTVVRLALISYANYHDENFAVSYTDVDYKVFTDAARHVYNGNSPYLRDTYRYPPLIAYLLVPNIFLFKEFGKVLFSIFDIFVTLAVKKLVEHHLDCKSEKSGLVSTYCALFWIYNPISIAISTRGNADSVTCFFIILSILFLQTDMVESLLKYALSGIFLALSIHLRIFPFVFSVPMYFSLKPFKRRITYVNILLHLLVPDAKQFTLAISCIATLVFLTVGMQLLYGFDFIFHTYIYHMLRKDTKHNFSILFYYSYLTIDNEQTDILKTALYCLQSAALFSLSLSFGFDPKTLSFSLFSQTVVLVAYNSVMTSQYFVWFLSLLPLVVHNFKLSLSHAALLFAIWVTPQAAWLFCAYLLEFQAQEVFIFIWMMSVVFFCANIIVLCELIKCFSPGYGFGLAEVFKPKKN